jgi:peptide methionine sulfoxide reductase MsrB
MRCRICDNENEAGYNFCRVCGAALYPDASNAGGGFSHQPYSWQIDDSNATKQTARKSRVTQTDLPASVPNPASPIQYPLQQAGQPVAFQQGSYHCPFCGTSYLPIIEKRISTAGWVVFALLLVFTFIFFWIGLLIKEEVAICPVCRNRVNAR